LGATAIFLKAAELIAVLTELECATMIAQSKKYQAEIDACGQLTFAFQRRVYDSNYINRTTSDMWNRLGTDLLKDLYNVSHHLTSCDCR
jgi:hypothetical protein